MISWLLVIIISYLFFSLSFFGDKLVVSGPANPKLYTFYVGALSILVVFLAPFTTFTMPSTTLMLWIVLEAIVYLLGLYTMFLALRKFDVSRVMTTIGGLQPIMILVLAWFFWGSVIGGINILAFVLLLVGSVLISLEKKLTITKGYVALVVFSSLMFSLDYVFSKIIFLGLPFLESIILMRLAAFFFILFLLFDKKLRQQIFSKKPVLDRKTGLIFLCTQCAGGIAGMLQSFAIALAPVGYLAIVNSLRGVQYVFLFLITLFFSIFFPRIFKEDISKKVVIQKVIAIALIVAGLAILV